MLDSKSTASVEASSASQTPAGQPALVRSPVALQTSEAIDALRGWAVLAVVAVHAAQYVPPASAAWVQAMAEGARGVQLFFLVSALTLCASWYQRAPHELTPLRNFYIRRAFRIVPLFYLAIIFYVWHFGVGARYWAPYGLHDWAVVATALFLHGWHPESINAVVPGGWSIAAEFGFYLLLPQLLRFTTTVQRSLFVFALTMLLYGANKIGVARFVIYPPELQQLSVDFSSLNLFGQLPVFLLGIVLYRVMQVNRLSGLAIGGLVAAVALSAALFFYPVRGAPHHVVASVVMAAAAGLLIRFPVRLLVNRCLVLIGKFSFGIYLSHFAVLDAVQAHSLAGSAPASDLQCLGHFLGVAMVAVACGALLHQTIEKPMVRYGARLISRLAFDFGRSGSRLTLIMFHQRCERLFGRTFQDA